MAEPGVLNFGRYRNALPTEIESQLKVNVVDMQRRLYRLRMRDMQHIAFDVAERESTPHSTESPGLQ